MVFRYISIDMVLYPYALPIDYILKPFPKLQPKLSLEL